MGSLRKFREDAVKKLGVIPSDHKGMDALRDKVWVEIKDLQFDLMMAERNGHDMLKLKRELQLRYTMTTILTRAIRKEKRNDTQ